MTKGDPTSFRLSPEARQMLDELQAHLGLKRTAVIEMLVRERYRAEGLPVTPKRARKKSKGGD